jgi:hypothetical protein
VFFSLQKIKNKVKLFGVILDSYLSSKVHFQISIILEVLPVVLRKRSNASGAGGAAEAKILKVRECPWYRRSGRESDATEVEAVEEIKYFDTFARIASVRCCCCSFSTTRKEVRHWKAVCSAFYNNGRNVSGNCN